MPYTTATVTGYMPEPNGVVFDGDTVVIFTLDRADVDAADDALIPNTPVKVSLDAGGLLSVNLWPNERGAKGSAYEVRALVTDTEVDTKYREIYFGKAQIPEAGGDIADFLSVGTVFDSVIVSTLTQSEYDAVIQAAQDAQDAAEAASAVAAPLQSALPFDSVSDLLASTRSALGVGSIWRGAGKMFLEADPAAVDHEYTTSGGVKLYDLHKRTGPAMTFWSGALSDGGVTPEIDGLIYRKNASLVGGDSCTDDIAVDGFAPEGAASLWHYGVVGDDVSDDRAKIQAAIDFVSSSGGGEVFFPIPPVAWRIEGTLNVPINVDLVGERRYSTLIRPRAGSYPSGYAVLVNTTDGSDWVTAYPNQRTPKVRNLRFETDDTSLYCIAFNGSFQIEDCHFKFFAKSIVGGPQYNDLVLIENCRFTHTSVPTTYQVELGNTGDAVIIRRCHFPNVANSPNTPLRSIKTEGTPISVQDFLGGDIYIETATAMSSLDRIGMDGGKIIVVDSNISIRNAALSSLENGPAITVDSTTSFAYSVEIDNSTISHDYNRGLYDPHEFDIAVDSDTVLTLNNVHRRALDGSSPKSRRLGGVKISSIAGVGLDAFNKYSYMYSTRCVLRNQRVDDGEFFIKTPGSTLNLLTPAFSFSGADWRAATGTYYYKAVQYYDTGRAVARNDSAAEVSQAATNGGAGIGLEITEGAYPSCKMIRVYRGTSSGSYDSYADIPIVNAPSLIDNGNVISGVPWVARAAGAVDAFNNYTIGGFGIRAGAAILIADAAPVSGTWSVGDEVKRRTPDAGESIGWLCVSAGTPGTWAPFGMIKSTSAYTASNVTSDRTFDADSTTVDELADVLGTLISDLKSGGVIS